MRYYHKKVEAYERKRDSAQIVREKIFVEAVKKGNLIQIKEWIELGVDINSPTILLATEGKSLLHVVNDIEIAEYLVGLGVDLGINKQEQGKNAFEYACKMGHAKIAQFLFKKGVRGDNTAYAKFAKLCVENDDIESLKILASLGIQISMNVEGYNYRGKTLADIAKSAMMREYLASINIFPKIASNSIEEPDYIKFAFEAVQKNDVDMVAALLAKDVEVNATHKMYKGHLLHNAVSVEMVNLLLDKGADINALSQEKYFECTALERACSYERFPAAIALLKRGATVNKERTLAQFLYTAVAENQYATISALIESGVPINIAIGEKPNVFYHVQTPNMVKFLIEKGATVFSAPTAKGGMAYICSPLHTACMHDNYDVVRAMLQAGFNVNVANTETGLTPLHIAAEYRSVEMVELLLAFRADVTAKKHSGETPLHMTDSSRIADLLIEAGAEINATTKSGLTLLSHAYANRHFSVIDNLKSRGAEINCGESAKFPLDEVALWGDAGQFTQLLRAGARYAPFPKLDTAITDFAKINYEKLKQIADAYAKIFALWKGGELLQNQLYNTESVFTKYADKYETQYKDLSGEEIDTSPSITLFGKKKTKVTKPEASVPKKSLPKQLIEAMKALKEHKQWIKTFYHTFSAFRKTVKEDLQCILKALLIMRELLQVTSNRAPEISLGSPLIAKPIDKEAFKLLEYLSTMAHINGYKEKEKKRKYNINDTDAISFLKEDRWRNYDLDKNDPWRLCLAILHYFGPHDNDCVDMGWRGAMGDRYEYTHSPALQLAAAIQQSILESQNKFGELVKEVDAYKAKIESLQSVCMYEENIAQVQSENIIHVQHTL